MKKRLPGFFTGFLSALLLIVLAVPAAALITSKTTIEVGPISIMVNGEVFQPTDVNGDPVDVFVYHGTTYAPLRALAEAYGLEVGYDEATKTATVSEPKEPDSKEPEPVESEQPVIPADYSDWSEEEEAAYQEFKSLWSDVSLGKSLSGDPVLSLTPSYGEDGTESILADILTSTQVDTIERFCVRFDEELYQQHRIPIIAYHFNCWGYWGWMDKLSEEWSYGYRNFYDTMPH